MTDLHTDQPTIARPDWLPQHTWPHRVRTLAVADQTIAYTDEGDGPALLLVHDGLWQFVWGQLIGRLAGDFRVVTLDFPGSGLSPGEGGAPSLRGDSELLEAVVDELGLGSFTPVVHDLGGPVGVGVAMRRPELVDGLVFINTFAWPPERRSLRAMFAVMSAAPVTALDVSTNLVPRLTSGRFGVGRLLDGDARSAFLGPFAEKGPRRRFHTVMGAARDAGEFLVEIERSLRTALAEQRVLTIFGEHNDPFGFQARFKELFPAARELVVPGGFHFPMADDPDLVATTIADWHQGDMSR